MMPTCLYFFTFREVVGCHFKSMYLGVTPGFEGDWPKQGIISEVLSHSHLLFCKLKINTVDDFED